MIFRKSIVKAAQGVAEAIAERDEKAFMKSFQAMASAAEGASPQECREALAILLPLLANIPLGPGGPVAQMVGSLAGLGGEPLLPLPVLVERAASAMEAAMGFVEAYRQLGVEPSDDDPNSAIERLIAQREGLGLTEREAYRLAEAFHTGGEWVQPVLYLCQRKEVRLALPQRERLTRAIEPMVEYIETAHWLHGLLQVLDDESLLVLHRETEQGFRLRISGIGDNFQLHTLLAAHLIGQVPGEPITATELSAATDGEMMPPTGIRGRFNLVDAEGNWVWNEGRPSDIPPLDGVRVVVLDPPPYARSWNAGRAYPLMAPEVVVERRLSPEEARELLSRVAQAKPIDPRELELTDDMTLPQAGWSYRELVDFIISGLLARKDPDALVSEVAGRFSLSPDNAELAIDRTCGGLVRAATRNRANQPPQEKDPVAWESFERGIADPAIIEPCTGAG